MRITDYTRPARAAGQLAGAAPSAEAARAPSSSQAPRVNGAAAPAALAPPGALLPRPAPGIDALTCAEAKIALQQARITHLEAVLEAARALMTSNQERLLRRLHDVPRDIAALTAQLDRLSAGPAACPEHPAEPTP